MSCKNIFLLSLLWAGLTNGEYVQSTYPSIVWNPWNPLFACNEPKINVRIGDIINFLCPSDELNFFVPSSSIKLVHENLFFLGNDKERYNACNATGLSISKKLLSCDDSQKLHTLSFRDIATKPDAITFTKGGTYYMIGTGFRVKSNLTNTEGGSCRYTDSQGKYKLRLQIYVCKDDESDCHICESEGCYYKDCGRSCTTWISDGQVYRNGSKCFKLETRTCSDALIGSSIKESRHADDPCSEYLKVTQDLSSKDGVIAGLSIGVVIAFLVGIMFGFLIIKCYNKTHDKVVVEHKSSPVNTVKRPPAPDGKVYNLFAVEKIGDDNLSN